MDEKKLINKIKKRDQKALIVFIDTYGKILKGAISPILAGRRELIEEVLDDCFLSVWENIDSYDQSRSSFKNWCACLAKYKAIDALRKEIRHQNLSTENIGDIAFEEEIDLGQVDELLSQLNKEDKIIFKKLFLDGFSYEDISKETGLSKNVLYNKVSRGKKLIRQEKKE